MILLLTLTVDIQSNAPATRGAGNRVHAEDSSDNHHQRYHTTRIVGGEYTPLAVRATHPNSTGFFPQMAICSRYVAATSCCPRRSDLQSRQLGRASCDSRFLSADSARPHKRCGGYAARISRSASRLNTACLQLTRSTLILPPRVAALSSLPRFCSRHR